jgi:site-specific DNA-methyltransferase (adenine-specific)
MLQLPPSAITVWDGRACVCQGDASLFYHEWQRPTVIIADGPYGLASFLGDPPTPNDLAAWYKPHAQAWYREALPSTTLWFWNSEQGWANCHTLLEACGWEFRNCHIWDKGIAHIAGNCNTKTIRKYPVVTEICAQYTRKNTLSSQGVQLPLRDWLRQEWLRSGLTLNKTNQACGVRNAATRKYFTQDHLWYFPPPEAFAALSAYANMHGKPEGRPYFSADGKTPLSPDEWAVMRAKFYCAMGVSNVWREPAVRGTERIKEKGACVHMNQKPLILLERIIRASSDVNDVVWEPFGGLCSATLAACRLQRKAFAAEINPFYFTAAVERLQTYENNEALLQNAFC